MRYYPDPDELEDNLKSSAAEPWMVEQLRRNWSYLGWGPHEDYQWIGDLSDPNSPRKFPTWGAFRKGFTPGEHPEVHQERTGGEIVGWYFNIAREVTKCKTCDQSGLNPESKKISDDWYDFARTGRKWNNKITQDEVDALLEQGRLWSFHSVNFRGGLDKLVEDGRITAERAEELWEGRDKTKDYEFEDGDRDGNVVKRLRVHIQWRDHVPVEEVNAGAGHDAINRSICVRTRCKRLGIWGYCESCNGDGYMPVDLKGRLQLVLWIVNPATGQNYGLEVDNIEQADLDSVYDFLGGMRDRLVSRLDMPSSFEIKPGGHIEKAFGKALKIHGRGESMMWTQDGSVLSSKEGWATPHYWNSWQEFTWPVDYKYGNRDDGNKVPKNHPKFDELNTGEPAYGLDDLNELIGARFEYGPHNQRIERVHFWIAHPRKGCSCRLTINNIRPEDYPSIYKYVTEGRERARERLDPSEAAED
jgi:hypothetical protein